MKAIVGILLYLGNAFALSQSQSPLQSSPDSVYKTFRSSHSPSHSLRITPQNDTLCNAHSRQYTGWLDVGTHHLFFWYFESQKEPENDPLTLWLTGGPGGSSMLGMLQELGPCLVGESGNTTVYNEYGWSKETNLLFVDQPAGVGFSYVDDEDAHPGPVPGTSFATAIDLHIFMQIFTSQAFPSLQKSAFHISGESYAGHYIPVLASQIVAQNSLYPRRPHVNLQSVLIGNGYVSPLDTAYGYWATLCTTKPGVDKPVFNQTRCDIMAANLPRCISLAQVCYSHPDPAICLAAESVCWFGVISLYDSESGAGGRNRFDITAPCEIDDFCYPSTVMVQKYLNLPHVQESLHIEPSMPAYGGNYTIASDAVNRAFMVTNDLGISTEPQVRYLLEHQIDVLFYQGNLDLACNTAGNLKWAESMAWKGGPEFASKSLKPWGNNRGNQVGTAKEVRIRMGAEGDEKRTRFSLVTVDQSGHMVPQDQPEVALAVLRKWLNEDEF